MSVDVNVLKLIKKAPYNKLLLFVLILQLSFIFMYVSAELVNLPRWLADCYWVLSGISGIVLGGFSIRKLNKTTALSNIVTIIGIFLILLLLLSLGITSM